MVSGLEVIGITDHNTCRNAPGVLAVAQEAGILAIPGMELCTAEEAHVVCLFETLEGALGFDRYIYKNMPHIQNKPEIFGEQRILNEDDELIGTLEELLLVSSFVTVDDARRLAEEYGGTAFPAHVDRDSYSVIAALGSIPPEGGYRVAEVTRDLAGAVPRAAGAGDCAGLGQPLSRHFGYRAAAEDCAGGAYG